MNKYQIALINVFWSENDINTRYFENVDTQNIYFNELTGGKFSPLVNFNMGNNVETSIVYRDTSGRSGDELCKCNYAVIEKVDESGTTISRRYFFAYPQQESGGQMRVTLSLDDIQTNYIRYKNTIAPCLIRRANLNRWIDNGDGTVSFNGAVTSKLFSSEPVQNVSKRLVKRTNLSFALDSTSNDSAFNTWYKNNIIGWEYVYLTQKEYNFYYPANDAHNACKYKILPTQYYTKDYKTINLNNDSEIKNNAISGALICIAVPIYKSDLNDNKRNVIIVRRGNYQVSITHKGLENFLAQNNNNTRVYARKFSMMPPLWLTKYIENTYYTISNMDSLILISGGTTNYYYTFNFQPGLFALDTLLENDIRQGVFYIGTQFSRAARTENYEITKNLVFNKSDIIGANTDPKFNPKLLNNQFFELNIVQGPQTYTYDLQKLNKSNFQIIYNEGLTPDITKGYARIADTNGVYIKECEDNFTGLVYSNDTSLMVDNDQLSQMLANNKNFFIQKGLDFFTGMGEAAVKGSLEKGLNSIFDVINTGLTLDNMRNAPRDVKNANGNVYYVSMIQPYNIAVEEYDILDTEKITLNDLMTQYGFLYNQIDNITNFDNIRTYYNYIECSVGIISAPISNLEKERLKQKLNSVRFWNTDIIQYSLENYERSIDNG